MGGQFFGTAHGFDLIVENHRELFYVTDRARGLFKTILDGQVLWHVEKPPFYLGPKNKALKYTPTNVAVAPGGDVYLADGYGSWFIHRFDKDGNYKSTFGGPGDGTAALDKPSPDATIHPTGFTWMFAAGSRCWWWRRTTRRAASPANSTPSTWAASTTPSRRTGRGRRAVYCSSSGWRTRSRSRPSR